MNLVKWNPWRDVEDLFGNYPRLVWPQGGDRGLAETMNWAPRVDISENGDAFLIKAELPEIRKEDVKITVENGALTLSGERKMEKEEKGKKYHRIERSYGSFSRMFTLPDNVDAAQAKAAFKDGMLTLTLPKTKQAAGKSLDVKIE